MLQRGPWPCDVHQGVSTTRDEREDICFGPVSRKQKSQTVNDSFLMINGKEGRLTIFASFVCLQGILTFSWQIMIFFWMWKDKHSFYFVWAVLQRKKKIKLQSVKRDFIYLFILIFTPCACPAPVSVKHTHISRKT